MNILKRIFLSLLIILSLSTGVKAEYFSDVIVTSPNGIWTDSRAYTSLSAAITAVGADQRTIVIAKAQVVAALIVPANVTLKFERDGSIANSAQLTINTKNIIAPDRQIFTGTGNIDFASGSVLSTSWFSNIETAFALTVNDKVTLVISKPQTVTASYALGNDVHLKWKAPDTILTVDAGVTVSNINQIVAGNYQILAGAGNFRFRDGTSLNLKWFTHLRTALTWIDTNKVTLVVSESSPVAFSDSIPSNIQIKVDKGGDLDIAPGITLTLNDPKQIDIGPYFFDPFTGAGSVTVTGGYTYTPASTLTAGVLRHLSLNQYDVDVLYTYGSGTSYTQAAIEAACTAAGSNLITLTLRPGTWVITSPMDLSTTCPNAIINTLPGVLLSYGAHDIRLPNPKVGGIFQWLSGTGLVTFTGSVQEIFSEWYGAVVGGSVDCAPAINKAGLSAASSFASEYKSHIVRFLSGIYLSKSTITLQPFVSYIGTRGAVANSSLPYTTSTDSHGTIIRAHTDIYDDDNTTSGVLIYIPAGDMIIENIEFVGAAIITAASSIGAQFGSSSTGRPHEGLDTNVSGLTMRNVRWVGFTLAWEIYNINDSYAYGYGFESNTTAIQILGRSTGAFMGTLEMIGGVVFASQRYLAIGDNANIDLHFVGGLFEGTAAANQQMIYSSGTKLPSTVGGYSPSFRFTGTKFRYLTGNVTGFHTLLNKDWTGFEGYFQFDGCTFENGQPSSGIYAVKGAGAVAANSIYLNNPHLKNTGITFDTATSVKVSGGTFDNSRILFDDVTKSSIINNTFKRATGANVTAITTTGTITDLLMTGNKADDTSVTDLISSASYTNRYNNPGDVDTDGTWTAAMVCGTSGSITLNNAFKTGHFIREGKKVILTGYFSVDSVGAPVGTLTITGLPFAASTGGPYYTSVSVIVDGLTSDATNPNYQGILLNGTSTILVSKINAGAASDLSGDIKAGTGIAINVTYFAD